jgi:hypothetical protein
MDDDDGLQVHCAIFSTQAQRAECNNMMLLLNTTATRFSLQQCKTIQSPVVCATLNKMAIHCNVARVIGFGPKSLGGMALCHLHTLQGIRKIQYFIGNIANNYGVGKLIRICIEATQLEVGTFEPFMFTLHSIYGPATLTASWVLEIWCFLELFKATITLKNSLLPLPQRQNDQSLMSLATLHTSCKGELRQISRCWIYLRVISVLDITYFDGTIVLHTCYDGLRSVDNTTILWTNQQRPTKGGWTIWRELLLSISDNNRYLLQPLGDWLDISNWYHHGEWFTASADCSLVHKVGNQCFSNSHQGRGNLQFSLNPNLLLHAPNLHSKALVKRQRTTLECTIPGR